MKTWLTILCVLVALSASAQERTVPANQQYGKEAPWNIVFGDSGPSDAFLACHNYQSSGGGPCPEQFAFSDLWFDAAHRRLWTRSLMLAEVDDPVDLSIVRIPGTYPSAPDFNASLGFAQVIGHVGFRAWRPTAGPGSYFAAMQGYQTETSPQYGYGIMVLATSPKVAGHTGPLFGTWRGDGGFPYVAGELVPHVALKENGQLVVGFGTSDANMPNPNLLVRGRVEGNNINQIRQVTAWSNGADRATAMCNADEVIVSGGPSCDNGSMRLSRPNGNGWEGVCSLPGQNRVDALCLRK